MKLAIQDANILIDLYLAGLLEATLKLSLEFHTTELVLQELAESEGKAVQRLVDENKMRVFEFSPEDLSDLLQFQAQAPRALTLEDCSVIYAAEKLDAVVLTGDGPVRKLCAKRSIEIHGTLWLMDKLVEEGLIRRTDAALAIERLIKAERRLPLRDCQQRIRAWSQ